MKPKKPKIKSNVIDNHIANGDDELPEITEPQPDTCVLCDCTAD